MKEKTRVVSYRKMQQRVFIGLTAWRDAGIDPETLDQLEIESKDGYIIIRPLPSEEEKQN